MSQVLIEKRSDRRHSERKHSYSHLIQKSSHTEPPHTERGTPLCFCIAWHKLKQADYLLSIAHCLFRLVLGAALLAILQAQIEKRDEKNEIGDENERRMDHSRLQEIVEWKGKVKQTGRQYRQREMDVVERQYIRGRKEIKAVRAGR